MLEIAGQMEHLAYTLQTGNSVTAIIKYFKFLFIYEDYSVINKVGIIFLLISLGLCKFRKDLESI